MKKIFILTEYFPPSSAATGRLLEELAFDAGDVFKINVITSIKRNNFDDRTKPYSVFRSFIHRFDKNKITGKILNSLSFFIYCFLIVLFRTKKTDLLFIVSNPPFLAVIGLIFYKLRKQKFIYLIHDQFPELAIKLGYLNEKSLTAKLWKKMNVRIFSSSLHTIALGESAGKHITGLYPVITAQNNLKIIPNWCDKNRIYQFPDKKTAKETFGLRGKFVVRYSGNFGLFHGMEILLDAAGLLKGKKDICFHLTGDGGNKKNLYGTAKRKQLDNVLFGDFIEEKNLNLSLNSADIAVLTLDDRANNLSVPSKFYSYIAAGLPVIAALNDETDIAFDIIKYRTGFVCNSAEDIAQRILELYESDEAIKNFSTNSYKLFLEKYERNIVIKKYIDLFGEPT